MEDKTMKKGKAPGKSHRKGISLIELTEMFPDEETAVKWFEKIYWPEQRCCGHCGSTKTAKAKHKTMPYWCNDCRKYFSVRTGTTLQSSRLPLRKWAFAVYLYVTHLKGVSSMKLHRDLKVTQKTAWFMLHRLREAWEESGLDALAGTVEIDETYIGGKDRNRHKSKKQHSTGREDKQAVLGMRLRKGKVVAMPVKDTKRKTLFPLIHKHVEKGSTIYTDDNPSYRSLRGDGTWPDDYFHQTVNHSAKEFVSGMAHTNGIESFWATLKRAHKGTYHQMSKKHMHRYVTEFSGRHNVRETDTEHQMQNVVAGMVGKRLMYSELISD